MKYKIENEKILTAIVSFLVVSILISSSSISIPFVSAVPYKSVLPINFKIDPNLKPTLEEGIPIAPEFISLTKADIEKQKLSYCAAHNYTNTEIKNKLYDSVPAFRNTKLAKSINFTEQDTLLDDPLVAAVVINIWDYPGNLADLGWGVYTYYAIASCVSSVGYYDYVELLNEDATYSNIAWMIGIFCDAYDYVDVFMCGHGCSTFSGTFVAYDAVDPDTGDANGCLCVFPGELVTYNPYHYHDYSKMRMGLFQFCHSWAFAEVFLNPSLENPTYENRAFVGADEPIYDQYNTYYAMWFCYYWYCYQVDSWVAHSYGYDGAFSYRGSFDVNDYAESNDSVYWYWGYN